MRCLFSERVPGMISADYGLIEPVDGKEER